MASESLKKVNAETELYTEYDEANQYVLRKVIARESCVSVWEAVHSKTSRNVFIKKINGIIENISDATNILKEIKLLRMLRHADVVEIKHIMLPRFPEEFLNICIVFERIQTNFLKVLRVYEKFDTKSCKLVLYQLLRFLKYIHSAYVFHGDLMPANILVNEDNKLKIGDFGLARVSFNDAPSPLFWNDHVGREWYRAPEYCDSSLSKYTPAIDIWSVGCIFAEMLIRKPLFPGKNAFHQLDMITDLLGTIPDETIAEVLSQETKLYLSSMQKKQPVPFSQKFPDVDPSALHLLELLLSFDPKNRPTAEEALAHSYFHGMANVECEPSTQPLSKLEFEFESRQLTKDDLRKLIYREILEYHPQMLQQYLWSIQVPDASHGTVLNHMEIL